MLMASHLAGVGQASGTGVGLVHALGHAIGTRGRVAHGSALAAVLPQVLAFYLGRRDHELALVGIAIGVGSTAETEATAAGATIAAIDQLLRDVRQRPTLRSLGLADDDTFWEGSPEEIADRLRPYVALGFSTVISEQPAPYDVETLERSIGEVKPLIDAG